MNDTCNICLNPVRSTRQTKELVCGHRFHAHCIDQWRESTCPVCRQHTNVLNKYTMNISLTNNHTSNIVNLDVESSILMNIVNQFDLHETDATYASIDVDLMDDESFIILMEALGVEPAYANTLITNTQ